MQTFFHEGDVTEKELSGKEPEEMIELIVEKVTNSYDEKEEQFAPEQMREFEKVIVLRAVDSKWMDHIDAMDQLAPRNSSSCIWSKRSAS